MIVKSHLEKDQLQTKFSSGSFLVNNQHVLALICLKTPILFNFYENRLKHAEFLEQVFRDFLESREMLTLDFQKRIFSIYSGKKSFYLSQNSIEKRLQILLVITIIIAFIRSYPHKLLVYENKNFLSLSKTIILKPNKRIFSHSFLVINKVYHHTLDHPSCLKYVNLSNKKHISKSLFKSDLHYMRLSDTLLLRRQNYTILFLNSEKKTLFNTL